MATVRTTQYVPSVRTGRGIPMLTHTVKKKKKKEDKMTEEKIMFL